MKNKHLVLAIVTMAVAAILSIAVVSCTKDKKTAESALSNSSKADNMDAYLMAFKAKLLSAQRGEEIISLEQAQRDLGNLLNFDFGDANYATNEFQRDTMYVSLLLTEENVDMSQLAEAYNKAYVKILETYKQVELPEKSVYSIFCSIQQQAKDDEASVRLILTTRGLINISLKTSFDTTDNWRVAFEMGKCDGTCVGDDHATMIGKVYMNNRTFSWDCAYGRVYFTNYGYDDFESYNYPESNPNIHYNEGYRLWYDSSNSGYETNHHCVEFPEMQYYYSNFVSIMNDIEQQFPDDYVLTNVECRVDCYLGFYHPYTFVCRYHYAKLNCTPYQGPDY